MPNGKSPWERWWEYESEKTFPGFGGEWQWPWTGWELPRESFWPQKGAEWQPYWERLGMAGPPFGRREPAPTGRAAQPPTPSPWPEEAMYPEGTQVGPIPEWGTPEWGMREAERATAEQRGDRATIIKQLEWYAEGLGELLTQIRPALEAMPLNQLMETLELYKQDWEQKVGRPARRQGLPTEALRGGMGGEAPVWESPGFADFWSDIMSGRLTPEMISPESPYRTYAESGLAGLAAAGIPSGPGTALSEQRFEARTGWLERWFKELGITPELPEGALDPSGFIRRGDVLAYAAEQPSFAEAKEAYPLKMMEEYGPTLWGRYQQSVAATPPTSFYPGQEGEVMPETFTEWFEKTPEAQFYYEEQKKSEWAALRRGEMATRGRWEVPRQFG